MNNTELRVGGVPQGEPDASGGEGGSRQEQAGQTASGANQTIEEKVIDALRQVYDPEVPVNIYDLGLIYDVAVDTKNNVEIRMTLTSPACPVAESLPGEVRAAVGRVPEVADCQVELVWEPQWGPDKMSDVAKLKLGML